jgi:hypothetical protein
LDTCKLATCARRSRASARAVDGRSRERLNRGRRHHALVNKTWVRIMICRPTLELPLGHGMPSPDLPEPSRCLLRFGCSQHSDVFACGNSRIVGDYSSRNERAARRLLRIERIGFKRRCARATQFLDLRDAQVFGVAARETGFNRPAIARPPIDRSPYRFQARQSCTRSDSGGGCRGAACAGGCGRFRCFSRSACPCTDRPS